MNWTTEILDFWFDELGSEDWFVASDTVDEQIVERFQGLWEEQKSKTASDFLDTPESALAAIILFDQFPRNMFRGTADAFSTDHLALQIAEKVIDREYDHKLSDDQKAFAYLPFMHSEDLEDQTRSLGLFTALGREDNLKFAREYRDIIARYGRFPHRNAVLGRETRPDEQEAIEQGLNW
ncbi:DUF924 family protein [Parasphingorhabdus sp.]|uniref:DUF924 family protein n=1 Tax=Parasphingorhabdus sp. TaxID=2709688 RepID=UPI002F9561C7